MTNEEKAKAYEGAPSAAFTYFGYGESAEAVAKALLKLGRKNNPDATGLLLEVNYTNDEPTFSGSLTVTP